MTKGTEPKKPIQLTYSIPETQATEMYKLYREKVTHEDTLINFRTTWFVALQAFLFTSFALSLDKVPSEVAKITPFLFSLVGLVVCFTTWKSVQAAHDAIAKTTSKWKSKDHVDGDGNSLGIAVKDVVDPQRLLPAIKGAGSNTGIDRRGAMSSIWLPPAIAIFWLVLSLYAAQDYLAATQAQSFQQSGPLGVPELAEPTKAPAQNDTRP